MSGIWCKNVAFEIKLWTTLLNVAKITQTPLLPASAVIHLRSLRARPIFNSHKCYIFPFFSLNSYFQSTSLTGFYPDVIHFLCLRVFYWSLFHTHLPQQDVCKLKLKFLKKKKNICWDHKALYFKTFFPLRSSCYQHTICQKTNLERS